MKKKCALIMAGGTGGHIMPGIALAELLRTRGWDIAWMGNVDGMEAQLIAGRGYEPAWIHFGALRGKGVWRALTLPFALLSGMLAARRQLRRIAPDVVIGFGGYVSFPGGLMAALLGIPLIVHEQNSIAGLANRVLARLARVVLCGFPGVLANSVWVGNPVRPEIAAIAAPQARYAERSGPLRLLVVGGSLGAKALNDLLPQVLARIAPEMRPQVMHQAGAQHLAALQRSYLDAGVSAQCLAFIADMPAAYAWADLVICRAGALTIAELAAAGLPSILVPFPFAVDDHQSANAHFLADAGAAILLPQSQLSVDALAQMHTLPRTQLAEMAAKARALAKPAATAALASYCEELAS